MPPWREDLHPRASNGRFGSAAATRDTRAADRAADVAEHATVRSTTRTPTSTPAGATASAAGPATISAEQFNATIPANRRLYRGVKSQAGADATMAGTLGKGDFGDAVYLGRSLSIAQGYAQQNGKDTGGRIVRAAITGTAKIAEPPRAVQRRGGTKVAEWAAANNVDVIDLGAYQVVRNPAVLTFDARTYSLDESVVMEHLADGYPLSSLRAGYEHAIRSLGVTG